MDPAIEMGTVIDETAATSFEAKVGDAVARGAKLLCGNVRRGALYSPTLIDHVTPDMPVVKYETFGPVSPVLRFRTIDEAIAVANGTDYGLSSAVCTNRLDYITRLVARAQRRHRQRPRGPWLPARAHALRRHQGLGARLQGRRAGSDEELHQRQDILAAMVGPPDGVRPWSDPSEGGLPESDPSQTPLPMPPPRAT